MTSRTTPFCAATAALAAAILTIAASPVYAIETRPILKTFFETGDIPTEQQFANLIDSYIHQTDDGLTLYGMAVTPDSGAGRFLRVGGNVGINELLPDTKLAAWNPPPNRPPIPGMCPSFCGAEHAFLPLQYVGPDGTSIHYAFLQVSMESDAVATLTGGLASVDPGPAIFAEYLVWETTPGATLTTFVVPEPTTATLLLVALAPLTARRRRKH